MYLKFYQLNQEPFQVTPDPEFLFPSRTHREALAAIVYGIEQRKGFIAITGDVGLGKTTVLRSYLDGPHAKGVRVVYVYNPQVTFDELLSTIYQELGLPPRAKSTFVALSGLHEALIDAYRNDEPVVLIVDEAQTMPVATLESLRLLSNLETATEKLIQIVLSGQTELDVLLTDKRLRQLDQRIAIRVRLEPLTHKESLAYIRYRLEKASFGSVPIMTAGAIEAVARAARGVPRSLNILADNALITGFGYQQRPVTARVAREVIDDRRRSRRPQGIPRHWLAAAGIAALVVGMLAWPLYRVGFDKDTRGWLPLGARENAASAAGTLDRLAHFGLSEARGLVEAVQVQLGTQEPSQSKGRADVTRAPPAEAPDHRNDPPARPPASVPAPAPAAPSPSLRDPLPARDSSVTSEAKPAGSEAGQSPAPNGATASAPLPQGADVAKPLLKASRGISKEQDSVAVAPSASEPATEPPLGLASAVPALDEPVSPPAPATAAPSGREEPDGDGLVWTVRRGDNATKIITSAYGRFNNRLLRIVQEANPHIPNINVIDQGDRLFLPGTPTDGVVERPVE